jgi:hypothetical protein
VEPFRDGDRTGISEVEHARFLLLLDQQLTLAAMKESDLDKRNHLRIQNPRFSKLGECTLLTMWSEASFDILAGFIKEVTFHTKDDSEILTFEAVPPQDLISSFKMRIDQYLQGVTDNWAMFRSTLLMKLSLMEAVPGLQVEPSDFFLDKINFADLVHRGPTKRFVKVPCSSKALAYVRHFKTRLPLFGMDLEIEVRQDRSVTQARLAEERRIAAARKQIRKELAIKRQQQRRNSTAGSSSAPSDWGQSRGDRKELPPNAGSLASGSSLVDAAKTASAAAASVGYSAHPDRPNSGDKRRHSKSGADKKPPLSTEEKEKVKKEKKEGKKKFNAEVDKEITSRLGFNPKEKPFGNK